LGFEEQLLTSEKVADDLHRIVDGFLRKPGATTLDESSV
jgi:hypothetical protein